jgi:hypothetical protein
MNVFSTESVLFGKEDKWCQYEDYFDEVWYIPQQHETCNGYFHTLYRTNVVTVPFIWEKQLREININRRGVIFFINVFIVIQRFCSTEIHRDFFKRFTEF